jgi:drug/metabolite transporter (DMT)-like permease
LAALTMSLEAVFAAAGGMLLLGERLTAREALGCLLVFGAVLLAQAPIGRAGRSFPTWTGLGARTHR